MDVHRSGRNVPERSPTSADQPNNSAYDEERENEAREHEEQWVLSRFDDVALPGLQEALDRTSHGNPRRCATQGNAAAMAADQK